MWGKTVKVFRSQTSVGNVSLGLSSNPEYLNSVFILTNYFLLFLETMVGLSFQFSNAPAVYKLSA